MIASLGEYLLRQGISPGDRVLIVSKNRIEFVEALLACFNIGATAVPLNPAVGPEMLKHVIATVDPAVCISDASFDRSLLRANCHFIRIDELHSIPEREFTLFERQPTDKALILFTSGSSGTPKAIFRTHKVLSSFINYFIKLYTSDKNVASRSPAILLLPLSHIGGMLDGLVAVALNRPLYMMDTFLPASYLKLVSKLKVHSIVLVPSMFSLISKHGVADKLDFGNVKYCFVGGEACPDSLYDRVKERFGAVAISTYGATECMPGISYPAEEKTHEKIRRGSCGRHIWGEVKLVDNELWVKNDTVEECYMDPAINAEKFVDGWYRTGDVFRIDEDGYYFWLGRVDDMFVCRGNNIYPVEIEKHLANCPGVEASCVAPITDKNDNTIVAVAIVKKGDITEGDVIRFLSKRCSTQLIPQFILFVDELPTLGIGKISRRAVRELLQVHRSR